MSATPKDQLSAAELAVLRVLVDGPGRWHDLALIAEATELGGPATRSTLRSLQKRGLVTGPPIQAHGRWSATTLSGAALERQNLEEVAR